MTRTKIKNQGLNTRVLGFVEVTSGQSGITTITDLTGLTVTINIPIAGSKIKISGFIPQIYGTNDNERFSFVIREGTTVIGGGYNLLSPSGKGQIGNISAVITPTAGNHTYKLSLVRDIGSGNIIWYADSSTKAYLLVEYL